MEMEMLSSSGLLDWSGNGNGNAVKFWYTRLVWNWKWKCCQVLVYLIGLETKMEMEMLSISALPDCHDSYSMVISLTAFVWCPLFKH